MTDKQEQGEPVAWMDNNGTLFNAVVNPEMFTPLYTTPQQRTWVGLMEYETYKLVNEFDDEPLTLALAIEAKLKEKNT